MKIKFLLFTILITQFLIAQQKKHSGYLINKETKKPIFGASILLDKRIISVSDEFGKFEFETDIHEDDKYVKIIHQSFEIDSILIGQLNEKPRKIKLIEKFTNLDEIVITAKLKLSKKEIIKNAVKQFKNSNRKKPYWASINQKQTLSHKGIPKAYFEMNGHAFMIGENKNPFIAPILIPNQIRRTKESQHISDLWFGKNKGKFLKASHVISRGTLFDFRCLESTHPLSKSGNKSFEFKIEKTETIDHEEYYVIHYNQNKRIHQKRNFFNMNGQLWINKKDFTLKKSNTGFDFDKLYYSRIKIDYKIINGIIYPSKIHTVRYQYKNSKNDDVANLIAKSSITFNTIDFKERENYRLMYPPYMKAFLTSSIYDKNYWGISPLKDKTFKKDVQEIIGNEDWNSAFSDGANEREYKKNSIIVKGIKVYEKKNSELLNRMKKDLINKN